MTTATIAVAASADDALQTTTTVNITNAGIGLIAADQWYGIRFNNVPIAQGQIVTSAFIDLEIDNSTKNDAEGTWYGEAHDSAPTFTTAASSISSRTSTAATVSWTTNDLGNAGDIVSSPNLATVVQEIVNRPGWVKGNSIVLIYDHNSSSDLLQVASYDHTTRQEPRLRLTYSGIGKVADRGNTGATSGGGYPGLNIDMAAAGSIAPGNWLIASISLSNSGTSGAAVALTVDDTRNGSWTVVGPANRTPSSIADDGATAYIAYVKASASYTNGDDVALHVTPSSVALAASIAEWVNIDSVTPLAGITPVTATGTSTTPSASITPGAAGQLVYGCLAHEGSTSDTYTVDADTTDGVWKTNTSQDGSHSGFLSDTTARSQWKIVTGTSAQTWNPTITSKDWAQLLVVFGVYSGVSRDMAAKADTSSSVKAPIKRARPVVTKAAVSSSTKAPLTPARSMVAKAAFSATPRGSLSIGGSISFAGVAATSSNARLRRVQPASIYIPQARTYQSKPNTSSSLRSVIRKTTRVIGKARQSANAKARLNYNRRLTVVGATNKPKISSKAKGTLDTTTSTGNTPAIPANVTSGPYASSMIGWGEFDYFYHTDATVNLWYGRGFKGISGGGRWPYGAGTNRNFRPSSVLAETNSQWDVQRLIETGQTIAKYKAKPAGVAYFHIRGSAASPSPKTWYPFNDWFDDALWNNTLIPTYNRFAEAAKWLGFDGMTFDFEAYGHASPGAAWDVKPGETTPLATLKAKVKQRGYQLGTAVWSGFPDMKLTWYAALAIPTGWYAVIATNISGGDPDNVPQDDGNGLFPSFYYGMVQAAKDLNATGSFHHIDATYYKSNQGGPLGASYTNSWILNVNRIRSFWSRFFDQATWDWFAGRNYMSPFVWISNEAGDQVKFSRDRGEPSTSQFLLSARQHGEDGEFYDYVYEGAPEKYITTPDWDTPSPPYGVNWYEYTGLNPPGGHLPGIAAATVVGNYVEPTNTAFVISGIGQSRSGNTVTLSFTARHNDWNIKNVHWKFYASNGTSILSQGEAKFTWNENGGHYDTNYNAAVWQCTAVIPNATSGQYVILDFYSTKKTRTSRRVQIT